MLYIWVNGNTFYFVPSFKLIKNHVQRVCAMTLLQLLYEDIFHSIYFQIHVVQST